MYLHYRVSHTGGLGRRSEVSEGEEERMMSCMEEKKDEE